MTESFLFREVSTLTRIKTPSIVYRRTSQPRSIGSWIILQNLPNKITTKELYNVLFLRNEFLKLWYSFRITLYKRIILTKVKPSNFHSTSTCYQRNGWILTNKIKPANLYNQLSLRWFVESLEKSLQESIFFFTLEEACSWSSLSSSSFQNLGCIWL